MTRTLVFGAAICTTLLFAAGCSSDSEAPDNEPVVDEAALVTGDYQTEPSEPFGELEQDEVLDFESQRMAEYVSLPYEINPELTERGQTPIHGIRDAGQVYGDTTQEQIVRDNSMLMGFMTMGTTPTAGDEKTAKQLNHQVLRFASEDNSRAAAQALHESYLAPQPSFDESQPPSPGGEPAEVPGHPETLAVTMPVDDTSNTQIVLAFTPRGEKMILDAFTVAPEDVQWALDAAANSVDVQGPLIDQFYGAETTLNPRPEGAPKVDREVDQDELLIYALPTTEDESNLNGSGKAVYGPRGFSHLNGDAERTYNALEDAGVENVAFWDTTVIRAEDDEKTAELADELIAIDKETGFKEIDSPAGLPTATCVSKAESMGMQYQCYIVNGRYIGISTALDDLEAAQQKISAQYLVLKQADQNA